MEERRQPTPCRIDPLRDTLPFPSAPSRSADSASTCAHRMNHIIRFVQQPRRTSTWPWNPQFLRPPTYSRVTACLTACPARILPANKKSRPPYRESGFIFRRKNPSLKSTYFVQSSICLANSSSAGSELSLFVFVQRQFNDAFDTVLAQDNGNTAADV